MNKTSRQKLKYLENKKSSSAEHITKFHRVIQSILMLYITLVLLLTPFHALWVTCGFMKSVQEQLITLLTTEILCTVSVLERWYLLLLHPLSNITSGMTVLKLNPPSNILVTRLANLFLQSIPRIVTYSYQACNPSKT